MAARFKFRLESLLRLREFEEDRARQRLYEVLNAAREKEQELEETVEARESAKADVLRSAGESQTLDMEDVLRRQRYLNVLMLKIARHQREVQAMRPQIESARAALRAARQSRKVVEKLRERARREHELAETRREVKELDEIGQVYSTRPQEAEVR